MGRLFVCVITLCLYELLFCIAVCFDRVCVLCVLCLRFCVEYVCVHVFPCVVVLSRVCVRVLLFFGCVVWDCVCVCLKLYCACLSFK